MPSGRSEQILVGLDVGTTKICTVVGEVVRGTLLIRGMQISPAQGMRKGVVVNMDELTLSIANALREAESGCGVEINSVYLGLSGAHVKGFGSIGAAGIGGREVGRREIEEALDSARSVYVPLDRDVLHVLPAGYAVDGQNGITDPSGMTCERLEAHVFVVTASVSAVRNLVACVNKAGVEGVEVVFSPLASAGVFLTEEEREMGAVFVDIGGGTTDILFFRDGWPRHCSVLAVGGNHFTNDIAVGLGVSVSEAEHIKKHVGIEALRRAGDGDEIEVSYEGRKRAFSRSRLVEILEARSYEVLDLIRKELTQCAAGDIAPTKVVLAGGGALLNGLDRMAESVWGVPVRLGSPLKKRGVQNMPDAPACATAAGLVLYGFDALPDMVRTRDAVAGVFGFIKGLAKEIFNRKKGGIAYVRN